MVMSIKVLGGASAIAYLNSKNKQSEALITKAMSDIGLHMEGEVKSSVAGGKAEPASVDTGRFLNSVQNKSNKVSATIFSEIPYANFLEYGTSKLNARRHFRNSLSRNKDKINQVVSNVLKAL